MKAQSINTRQITDQITKVKVNSLVPIKITYDSKN